MIHPRNPGVVVRSGAVAVILGIIAWIALRSPGVAVLLLLALLVLVFSRRRSLTMADLEVLWAESLEPMLLLDHRGRLAGHNRAASRLLTLADTSGEPVDAAERLVVEEARGAWRERFDAVLSGRKRKGGEETAARVTLNLEEGETLPARVAMVPLEVGGERCVLVHLRDLRAEARVAELEETLRSSTRQLTQKELELQITQARKAAIFSASLDCIVGVDGQWKVIEWNPATVSAFGYTDGELPGMTLLDLVGPDREAERCPNGAGGVVDGGGRVRVGERFETCARRRDGSVFPAEVSVVRVEAAGPPLLTAYIVDITERKNVERIKNEFISIVSHELRTPLTSIRGSLGLLEGGVAGPIEGSARELVHIARSNSDRLIRLINDMLDLEKMQSGKDELLIEPVEPGALVRSAIAAVQGMAEESGVVIVEEVDCHRTVMGDKDRLVQVVTNLLSNAVKASPRGAEVGVSAREGPDGRLRVSVEDRGDGIPADQLPYLFDRFKRIDNPAFRQKRGTGLGLAISKTIMAQHHGTIEVEGGTGRGARFTMIMPFEGPQA